MAELPDTTGIDDQRDTVRRTREAPVRVTIETEALEGLSDNVSSAGIMFFTDEPLRVAVALECDGVTETRRGTLVRVQRMSRSSTSTRTGFAIEFDSE